MDIDAEAKRLEKEINDEIAKRSLGRSFMAMNSILEQIVREKLDTDRWEYLIKDIIGKPSQIVLTRYNPPSFGEPERFDYYDR